MGSARRLEIKASLREIVLIVVGVLLAFGVEARWSGAQEDREDTGYLRALGDELREDQGELDGVRRSASAVGAAADTLRMGRTGQLQLSPAHIAHLIWRASSVAQIEMTSTSLENLFRSRTWGRMSDAALQQALATHDQSLRELELANTRVTEYWFEAFEPVLRARIDYDEWEMAFRNPQDLPPSESMGEWVLLLQDREITNLLVHTEWFAEEAERRANELSRQIDEILTMLPAPD